jgi:hypothetical protein
MAQTVHYLRQPILALAALGSGAALVVAILYQIPLGLTLLLFAVTVVALVASRVSRLPGDLRAIVRTQAMRGAIIGLTATLAYDLIRQFLVVVADLRIRPFETWVLFGYAILGSSASRGAAIVAGTTYHYANGTFFAVSYGLLIGGRPWFCGVLWALGLEMLMLAIYPRWLDLRQVVAEFTVVSIVGHLAYGLTLGVLGQRFLYRAFPRWQVQP